MNELKRILLNKKVVVMFLIITILNVFLYYNEQKNTYLTYENRYDLSVKQLFTVYNQMVEPFRGKSIAECREQLASLSEEQFQIDSELFMQLEIKLEDSVAYCEDYPNYLEEIQQRAQQLSTVSIFSTEDGFSSENIKKTASEFKSLDNTQLNVGVDESITNFLSYIWADYFVLLLIIVIAYQMIAERKNGLWEIVHLTRNGRVHLALKRFAILCFGSIIACIVVYGGTLMSSFYLFGGIHDLNRSMQSIAEFQSYSVQTSVLGFLVQYIGIKCVTTLLAGLIVWFVLSAISNLSIGLLLLGAMMAVEYSLFYFLPVQSVWNVFKYINVFSYIDLDQIYIHYLNINIFSKAVSARRLILSLLPIGIVGFGGGAVVVNGWKHPKESSRFLGHLFQRIQKLSNSIVKRLHTVGLELYKLLFIKKGIVIVLVFALYEHSMIASGNAFYGTVEQYYNSYIDKVDGIVTEDKLSIVKEIGDSIETSQQELNALSDKLEKNEITKEEYEKEYSYNNYDALEEQTAAYEKLEETVSRLEDASTKTGTALYIMHEYGYEELLSSDSYHQQDLSALIGVFVMILLFSSCIVYEKQNTTFYLLRSMRQGRGRLYHKKLVAGGILTCCIWAISCCVELLSIYNVYGFPHLNASIQSIACMNDWPFSISIFSYLILVYLVRLLMLLSVMYIIYWVSGLVQKEQYALLINCIILVLPSVIYYIGIDFMKYFSVISPIDTICSIGDLSSSLLGGAQIFLLLAIGIFARIKGSLHWSN